MEYKYTGIKYIASKVTIDSIHNKCSIKMPKMPESYSSNTCDECGATYRAWKGTQLKLCCACKEIRRRIQIKSGILKIHDGYPREKVFTDIEELEEYYAGEKITCLLCGNDFNSLNHHLRKMHEMTVDEYRIEYGLPFARGLNGTHTHDLLSAHGHRQIANQGGVEAAVKRMHAAPRGQARNQKHAPALQKKQRRALKAAGLPKNHISKLTNLVDALCSDCGEVLDHKVTEATLITSQCKLLCKKCGYEHQKISQQRWADKKGIDLVEYKKEIANKWNAKNRVHNNKRSRERYYKNKLTKELET